MLKDFYELEYREWTGSSHEHRLHFFPRQVELNQRELDTLLVFVVDTR